RFSLLPALTLRFQPFILRYCSLRDFRLCAHSAGLCGNLSGGGGGSKFQCSSQSRIWRFTRSISGRRSARVRLIWVKGKLDTSLEVLCARCLDPVVHEVERSFDLLYRPLGTDSGHAELSVTDAEAEIGYYEGEGLLLEDTLREQVLLALPLRTICREDCKGLCPHCGKNLNEIQCSCVDEVEDPRWSALKEIRDKLNQ